MRLRSVAVLVAVSAISTFAEHIQAQTLVLQLDGFSGVDPNGEALAPRVSGTTLPSIVLGGTSRLDADSTFLIADSAIRRPEGGEAGSKTGFEYHLAQPGVGSFERSTDGVNRFDFKGPVTLPSPDGRSIAVYQIYLTADVPSGKSGLTNAFPVLVEGWREGIGPDGERTGKMELAFHGVLAGRLREE